MVTHLYIDGPYDGAELPAARRTVEEAEGDLAIDLPAVPGRPPGEIVKPGAPLVEGKVRYVLAGFQPVSASETAALYHHQPIEPGAPA